MEINAKIRELLESMDAAGREALARELAALAEPPPSTAVGIDDITVERLADATFAARVRAEIRAALRGEI